MLQTMLSEDSIAQMSAKTGTSTDEVKSVLHSALPAMLSGVQGQASDLSTVEGFAGALDSHALDDTSDINAFLSNVDIQDGEKIVGHLLGGAQATTTDAAAKKAGLNTSTTGSILGAAAPLLMSLLGQQATQTVQAQSQNGLSSGNTRPSASSGSGLLAGLLSGSQQQASVQPSGLGGLLGKLFSSTQQHTENINPLGSMVGNMLGSADVSSLLSSLLGSDK